MEHVEAGATPEPEPELDEALARAIRQLITGAIESERAPSNLSRHPASRAIRHCGR
jgi:hypothetical protein